MKIEANGKTFEYTVDGQPLEDEAIFEAFIALGSTHFPFAVVTRGTDDESAVRAVTFAADEQYVDALVDCMEDKISTDEEIDVLGLNTGDDEDDDDRTDI